ncbi:MAG: hypothetical protein WKF37_17860 [Bryobacteraceae bacterium]
MENDARVIAEFLRTVYRGQEDGYVSLFEKETHRSTFVPLNRARWYNEAAEHAMRVRDEQDVYFGIGVQGEEPCKGRGTQAGVIALPGLWGDIDVFGPNHAATNLPPTLEDAWSITRVIPFKPTLVVYSGGGLQPHWLLREPMEIQTDRDRRAAILLSKSFQSVLARSASANGWTVDNTADLCRLLRVPGTYNRKQNEPILVQYEVIDGGQRTTCQSSRNSWSWRGTHTSRLTFRVPRGRLRALYFCAFWRDAHGCTIAKTTPPDCLSQSGIACCRSWDGALTATRSPTS